MYDEIVEAIVALANDPGREKSGLFIQVGTSFTDETDDEKESFFKNWIGKVDHVYAMNTHLEHVKHMDRIKELNVQAKPIYRNIQCGRANSMMFVAWDGKSIVLLQRL